MTSGGWATDYLDNLLAEICLWAELPNFSSQQLKQQFRTNANRLSYGMFTRDDRRSDRRRDRSRVHLHEETVGATIGATGFAADRSLR